MRRRFHGRLCPGLGSADSETAYRAHGTGSIARQRLCTPRLEVILIAMRGSPTPSGQNLTLGTHGYNGSLRPNSEHCRRIERLTKADVNQVTLNREIAGGDQC